MKEFCLLLGRVVRCLWCCRCCAELSFPSTRKKEKCEYAEVPTSNCDEFVASPKLSSSKRRYANTKRIADAGAVVIEMPASVASDGECVTGTVVTAPYAFCYDLEKLVFASDLYRKKRVIKKHGADGFSERKAVCGLNRLVHAAVCSLPSDCVSRIASFISTDLRYLRQCIARHSLRRKHAVRELHAKWERLKRVDATVSAPQLGVTVFGKCDWKQKVRSEFSTFGVSLVLLNECDADDVCVYWLPYSGDALRANGVVRRSQCLSLVVRVSHVFVFKSLATDAVIGLYQPRHSYPTHILHFGGAKHCQLTAASYGSPLYPCAFAPDSQCEKSYETEEMHGFRVHFEKHPLDVLAIAELRRSLACDFRWISETIPAHICRVLRRTEVWCNGRTEYGHSDGRNAMRGMSFHRDANWLIANGIALSKMCSVEIFRCEDYLQWRVCQPLILFHEFCHAFHFDIGLQRADVRKAFAAAMRRGLYRCVPCVVSVDSRTQTSKTRLTRGYQTTNAQEYFAQLSEAYFGRCNYFPFDRNQLKAYDSVGFKLIRKLWQ